MTADSPEVSERAIEPLICDYCGCYIEERGQKCPSLDDGRCAP